MDTNPFLSVALSTGALAETNVATSLDFLVARALASGDPALCYSEDLVRAAAASTGQQCRDASRKLKTKFSKDFNLQQWNADVRDARADLVRAAPSTLIQSENGTVKPNLANAAIQLSASGVSLGYDLFSSRITLKNPTPWGTDGAWKDIDDIAGANCLQHTGVNVPSSTVNEAAYLLAYRNKFHPVRDWLSSLTWDGTHRLNRWMIDHLGVEESRYTIAVGVKWMISAVARIMRPGCKADYMIVMEGPQGQRKSMALRALANGHLDGDSGVQWFRDSLPDIDKDDIGLYMQGVWIIEVAELSAISGKQWEKTKAFISSQVDTFRRKFGRNMQDYPRQCIFSASTNEDHWAGDPTGARRFWPITPAAVDIAGILRDREQLWAEAVHRYNEGESWWLDQEIEDEARLVQAERSPDDIWVDRISDIVGLMTECSISELMGKMGIPADKQDQRSTVRIAKALAVLGWKRSRSTSGTRKRVYRRPD